MAHLAFVTPYLPAPDNTGGRIRMHRLARALARVATVDLFARVFPIERSPDTAEALSVYRAVHLREGDLGRLRFAGSSRRLMEASPLRLALDLRRAHRERPYDAVVASHVYATGTARAVDVPMVLDEHNIESRYAAALRPDDVREVARLRGLERRAWRDAALVTTVTAADAAVVAEVRGAPATVIPNGADADDARFRAPSDRTSHALLFVGAMSHAPNVAAAVLLAREVLPRVRRTIPDATLVLCGRAPDATVRALASEHVTVTGTVPSTAPFLDAAGVFVNALARGEGSSLKLVEAFAAGVPVVSTAVGARGFDVAADRELLLTDDAPEHLADAVLRCFSDPDGADLRARRARSLAETLDWNRIGERFAHAVLGVLR